MLSRAAICSLRTPVQRATPVALRITSSTIWSRSMAKNHRSGQRPDYSKPTGASTTFKPGAQSNDKSSRPDFNSKQEEISKGASPKRNTIPQSEGTGAGELNSHSRKGEDPSFSKSQEEFKSASPEENTAPQSTSPSATDPAEVRQPSQPLPDLTRGIPSSLEFETTGSTKSQVTPLNLTEAEEPGQSGGGRGKGELPASAYVSSSERKRLALANYLYASFAVAAVTGTIYLGRNWESEEEEAAHPEAPSGWAIGLMWNRAKARLDNQLSYYHEPAFAKLLPNPDPIFERPYTLVLSMEDLLIHSEWTREHGWRLAKRPGVDYFLRYLSQYYELVIFTSQPWTMAEPVIRKLDPYHIVTWPLFREATKYEDGEYVKDLSYLNRDLSKVIIIDTKKEHVKRQPENAIVLKPWEGNVQDKELVSLIPFLEYIHTMAIPDVRKAISSFEGHHIPTEFNKREAIARKKFQEQVAQEQKKKPKHSGVGFLGSALGIKNQPMFVDPNEQTAAEAFAQGKMLQDQARERGQRNYEALEKEIRENGEKWLKEESALEEKAKEEAMKNMQSGFTSWFGGGKS